MNFIEFTTFLALLAIPGFFGWLDSFIQQEAKMQFSSSLQTFSSHSIVKAVKDLNHAFVDLFEFLYIDSDKRTHISVNLIISFPFMIAIVLYDQHRSTPSTVREMVGVVLAAGLVVHLFEYYAKSSHRTRGIPFRLLITSSLLLLSYIVASIPSVTLVFLIVLAYLFVPPVNKDYFGLASYIPRTRVAVLTSLFSVIFFGLLFNQAWPALWASVTIDVWNELDYIFVNILADIVSLVETFAVLKWAQKRPLSWLPFILILDLIFSASIFLVIPLAGSELPTFIAGITLGGPKPWLGILFWSTFMTSFLFYIFVIGSILVGAIHQVVRNMVKLDSVFQITNRPFSAVGMVVFSFMFIGAIAWPFVF